MPDKPDKPKRSQRQQAPTLAQLDTARRYHSEAFVPLGKGREGQVAMVIRERGEDGKIYISAPTVDEFDAVAELVHLRAFDLSSSI